MQILQWWQMKSKQITRKSGHRCASLICITWISSIACITYTTEISHQMILWDDIDIDLKMNQVANLRTLWCAFYKPKWCGGVPKYTDMRYDHLHCHLSWHPEQHQQYYPCYHQHHTIMTTITINRNIAPNTFTKIIEMKKLHQIP